MMIAKMPSASRLLPAFAVVLALAAQAPPPPGRLLFSDDFTQGLSRWSVELERPGLVEAKGGILKIDVPAGATVWFQPELSSPVIIEYDAILIRGGGPNDRVSDLNCFWMADGGGRTRSGKFADYNDLRTYYVGQGGNTNTTTRFRRYIGDQQLRPLLPEHDLTAPLLQPNREIHVRLVAKGSLVQYWNNERLIFDYRDPEPYTRGRFGFRTTFSHVELRNFRVHAP
jgi:hypothetical protein